jgi:hypothetical protein
MITIIIMEVNNPKDEVDQKGAETQGSRLRERKNVLHKIKGH